jgi:Protein of unknown function (DUF2809)
MNRSHYFLLTITTLLTGYFSRQNTVEARNPDYFGKAGTFIHNYAGDALWAGMIYFGFRFLLPKAPLKTSVLYTFLFTYCIEISQLYQADWVNAIRHTKLGGLVLGFGFLWSDLLMYTIGISLAFLLDVWLSKFMKNRKH